MNLSNSDNIDIKKFNVEFFKNIENKEEDCQSYIDEIISKYNVNDISEVNALVIYYFWNFYFTKLFPNVIEKKVSKNSDPRKSSVFKYCYKLQKETKGILNTSEYKDYVYCQLRFLKSYKDKTSKAVLVSPSILNLDKGWKKYKYFKYLLSKNKQTVQKDDKYVNNDNLKIALNDDKKFLKSKIEILNKENLIKNLNKVLFWHKIGNISVYFLALCDLIDKNLIKKDLSVYKFNKNGYKIYKSIFYEL